MTLKSTQIRTTFFSIFGSDPIADGSSSSLPVFTSTVWDKGIQPLFLLSLKKARKDYSGNVVRLIRLSDFQEKSFTFDVTNEVDSLAMQAWASSAGCKIVKWNDQGGLGNDAIGLNLTTSFDFNPVEVRIEASTGVSNSGCVLYIDDVSVSPIYTLFANAVRNNNAGNPEHIIGAAVTLNFPFSGILFNGTTDSTGIGQRDSGTALAKADYSVDDAQWHRIIGTFASVNSKLYNDRTNTTTGSTGTTNYKQTQFIIGNSHYWASGRPLTTGFIDFAACIQTSLGNTDVSAYDEWMRAKTSRS